MASVREDRTVVSSQVLPQQYPVLSVAVYLGNGEWCMFVCLHREWSESVYTVYPSWLLMCCNPAQNRPFFFSFNDWGGWGGLAIFHRRLLSLIHSFPLFSQMALELKTLTVPNATDDLPDLLPLQFCPLISLPRPPSRTLVMRKWAVVFVYWACLSGHASSAAFEWEQGNKRLSRQCFRKAARSIVNAGKPERFANRGAADVAQQSALKCLRLISGTEWKQEVKCRNRFSISRQRPLQCFLVSASSSWSLLAQNLSGDGKLQLWNGIRCLKSGRLPRWFFSVYTALMCHTNSRNVHTRFGQTAAVPTGHFQWLTAKRLTLKIFNNFETYFFCLRMPHFECGSFYLGGNLPVKMLSLFFNIKKLFSLISTDVLPGNCHFIYLFIIYFLGLLDLIDFANVKGSF